MNRRERVGQPIASAGRRQITDKRAVVQPATPVGWRRIGEAAVNSTTLQRMKGRKSGWGTSALRFFVTTTYPGTDGWYPR